MTIISSLSLSMSNHLKKSCFDYFLLDDSPSRMVKVKESYDLKLWLFIIKFISLPKVIIWQIIWLANTLYHKNSQDNWCIVMLCGILNQRKSEQSPFKKNVSPDGLQWNWPVTKKFKVAHESQTLHANFK